jgi:hypothetical protein
MPNAGPFSYYIVLVIPESADLEDLNAPSIPISLFNILLLPVPGAPKGIIEACFDKMLSIYIYIDWLIIYYSY